MIMTLEQKQQHRIASQIPMNLWNRHCYNIPIDWDTSIIEATRLEDLRREQLPKSSKQAFIVLLITHQRYSANQLIDYCLSQLKKLRDNVFHIPAAMGRLDILQALLARFPKEEQQIIVRSVIVGADQWDFRDACQNGHLETAQWLFEQLSVEQRQAMIASFEYGSAFYDACQNRHLDIAQWLMEQLSVEQHQAMIASFEYGAFRNACQNGHLDIAQWLVEQSSAEQRQAMIASFHYDAFCDACENGHLDIAQWLVEQSSAEQSQAMIASYNYGAFREACQKGHLDIAQWLVEQLSAEQRQAMIAALDYGVCAGHGANLGGESPLWADSNWFTSREQGCPP